MSRRDDTIFALSSGAPPAALAIVRISGPEALAALARLGGGSPAPRRATLTRLVSPVDGGLLDEGLVLVFPGPRSATGEDLVELHLHGGRAVVRAVEQALAGIGLRSAEPGEFTRRAFGNGRIGLNEAEALADLLAAETESQRRAAAQLLDGALTRLVLGWRERLLSLSAGIEAALDFADEDDVGDADVWDRPGCRALANDIAATLTAPPAERLRDGIRVVLAGPVNAGKSSLLNALVGRDAAIVLDEAGTTRDLIEVPVAIDGIPFLLIDSAGLRDTTGQVEAIGIARAHQAIAAADIVLWLGAADAKPDHPLTLTLAPKADLAGHSAVGDRLAISTVTGQGLSDLRNELTMRARTLLPREGEMALNARQRELLANSAFEIQQASVAKDTLIAAEHLRLARESLDRLVGQADVEAVLNTLFGRFCIGK